MRYPNCYIISAMAMIALGAFAGVLYLVAIGLFTAGFQIHSWNHTAGTIGAWVGSGIILIGAVYITYLFKRAYRKQKRREEIEDLEKEIRL